MDVYICLSLRHLLDRVLKIGYFHCCRTTVTKWQAFIGKILYEDLARYSNCVLKKYHAIWNFGKYRFLASLAKSLHFDPGSPSPIKVSPHFPYTRSANPPGQVTLGPISIEELRFGAVRKSRTQEGRARGAHGALKSSNMMQTFFKRCLETIFSKNSNQFIFVLKHKRSSGQDIHAVFFH